MARRSKWVRQADGSHCPVEELRLVVDITSSGSNRRIRVRDLIKQPGPPEARLILGRSQRLAPTGKLCYFKSDVSKCHQRILRSQGDRRFSVVSPSPGRNYIGNVGDFGGSSSAYWAGRLMAIPHRLVFHWIQILEIWQLLYADDTMVAAPIQCIWVVVTMWTFFMSLVGMPLSWHKLAIGLSIEWLGHLLLGNVYALGIADSRRAQVIHDLSELLKCTFVSPFMIQRSAHVWAWVAQVIEPVRPFLGPLFTFLHGGPLRRRVQMPHVVRMALSALLHFAVRAGSFRPMETKSPSKCSCYADASAMDGAIRLGGWFGEAGCTKDAAYWFVGTLTPDRHPWALAGRSLTAVVFVTEMLAPLVLARALAQVFPGILAETCLNVHTDSQSAEASVNNMYSKSIPGLCVLFAMASEQLASESLLRLRWIPRELNEWADQLSRHDSNGFSQQLHVHVNMDFDEVLAFWNIFQHPIGQAMDVGEVIVL